jgi:hypothetical protein
MLQEAAEVEPVSRLLPIGDSVDQLVQFLSHDVSMQNKRWDFWVFSVPR